MQHVKWSGVLNRKRLRAGRYVVEIVETDAVGNATDDAPYQDLHGDQSTALTAGLQRQGKRGGPGECLLRGHNRDTHGAAAVRAPDARLPRLPGVRARPVPQHAGGLPLGPAPVRALPRRALGLRARPPAAPTSPTSSPTWPQDNERPAASTATIHRKAACLRSFYRHLRREGMLDSDPTAALSAPRRGRKLPHVLTRDEVNQAAEPAAGHRPAAAARPRTARDDVRLRPAGRRRRSGSSWRTSTSTSRCCGRAARARRSAWCRSAVRPSRR